MSGRKLHIAVRTSKFFSMFAVSAPEPAKHTSIPKNPALIAAISAKLAKQTWLLMEINSKKLLQKLVKIN
jgi:hypothetical protein